MDESTDIEYPYDVRFGDHRRPGVIVETIQ